VDGDELVGAVVEGGELVFTAFAFEIDEDSMGEGTLEGPEIV